MTTKKASQSQLPPHIALRRKVQAYSFMSTFFLVIGGIIFLNLYVDNIEGRWLEALRKPATVGMVLLPFLPAFVLSLMATKAQNKYRALLKKMAADAAAPPKK